jgi:transcriptional regulator with XRE-family HTH domain
VLTLAEKHISDPRKMSPFARLLHDLRMRHSIRQGDLAKLLGHHQGYVSALEIGIKGPPPPEFVEKLISVLDLGADEQEELHEAVAASDR